MNLQNKVAVVTGASRGLGKHFSAQLIEKGAIVFGLARNEADLNGVRNGLGEHFHPMVCDVTDPDAVKRAFSTIQESADSLDILINNAGLGRFGAVEEQSLDDWNLQIDVNISGVHHCTREAVPAMKAQNKQSGFGGHIVNIASVAGLVGNAHLSAYNATKFALRGYSEALMKELREDGIKVSCINPGSVATHFAGAAGSSGSPNPMQPEDVAATVIHVLEGPDNYLISEVAMRPLRPKGE